ncbi:MAG: hypothetical protein ACOCWQ_04940, partial [Nanoarchaeota archaeon]
EGHIDDSLFDRLKWSLLKLEFLSYSPTSADANTITLDKRHHLDLIRKDLIQLIPEMTTKCSGKSASIYTEDMQKKEQIQQENLHAHSRKHKEDIINTERRINKQLLSDEHFETPEKDNDGPESDSSYEKLERLRIPFDEVFHGATGFPVSRLIELDFSEKEKRRTIWVLCIKYFLLKKIPPQDIVDRLKGYGLPEELTVAYLSEHRRYLSSLKRFLYLQELIEVIVLSSLHILLDKDIKSILSDMTRRGYDREVVLYAFSHSLLEE